VIGCISVALHPSYRPLAVSVEDTGIGIPAQGLEHIFQVCFFKCFDCSFNYFIYEKQLFSRVFRSWTPAWAASSAAPVSDSPSARSSAT
jgi:hypothetical protein